MKLFDKWIVKKYNDIIKMNKMDIQKDQLISSKNSMYIESDNAINFTVFRADGGHVVQHRNADSRKTGINSKLTIINDTDDLGEVLTRIIVLEALRS